MIVNFPALPHHGQADFMNEQLVYVLQHESSVVGVFSSPEKAFAAIRKDEYTEFTQTVRTSDGYEEFTPTAENFYLGAKIYVHTFAHQELIAVFENDVSESNEVYVINVFNLK